LDKTAEKKYRLQEDVLKIGSHCGGWMIAWHEESGKISLGIAGFFSINYCSNSLQHADH